MEGVPIKIGSVTYKVPDPTMEAAEKALLRLEAIAADGTPGPARLSAICEVIHALLVENYPDLKLGDVKRTLKLKDAVAAMRGVMAAAGMEAKNEGEARTP